MDNRAAIDGPLTLMDDREVITRMRSLDGFAIAYWRTRSMCVCLPSASDLPLFTGHHVVLGLAQPTPSLIPRQRWIHPGLTVASCGSLTLCVDEAAQLQPARMKDHR